MDTHTLIALSILTDHLKRQEALIRETLELIDRIPKVPDDPEAIDPPCRMTPAKADEPAEPEKKYTFEEARKIFTDRSKRGLKAEMKSILTAHGLQKLSGAKEDSHLLNLIAAEAEATGNA